MQIKSFLKAALLTGTLVSLMACAPKVPDFDEEFDESLSMLEEQGTYGSAVGDRTVLDGQSVELTNTSPTSDIYYFDYDSSNVKAASRPSIHKQAQYLINHQNAEVVLAGNTDERGSREYNIALGERRANHVKQLLLLDGVSAEQIRVVSYGEEKPINASHDESAYRLNRRVELNFEAIG